MTPQQREKRRTDYLKKLRDPRWQRKRLEIMQRDEFMCQNCGDTETTLNVHHNYYENREPWDYPNSALVTLCENCHQEETENRRYEESLLLYVCRAMGLNAGGLNGLMLALHEIGEFPKFHDRWDYELTWMISHFWELRELIEPIRREFEEKRTEARLAREAEAKTV